MLAAHCRVTYSLGRKPWQGIGMTHLWVRAESRPNEDRVGITPDGVALLIGQGMRVTVEDSPRRIIPTGPPLASTRPTTEAEFTP